MREIGPLSRRGCGRDEGPLLRRVRIGAVVVFIIALLGACSVSGRRTDSTSVGAAPASQVMTQTPTMRTGGTLPPRAVGNAQPDFNGIGPLRFGMTAQQMRKAWGVPLYGEAPLKDPLACYYLRLRKDDYGLLLMIEGGKFVRADVRKDSIPAPGGGRVGMTGDAMRKLYAGRIQTAPNKYDPPAQTLRVVPLHNEPARLVFEVDARGKVRSWRVGVPPQVDYVEGCS